MRDSWKQPFRAPQWVATGAGLVAATVVVWAWPQLPADGPTSRELLSAIAQSLAAVLAIVFALSIMVVEAGTRYSHRVSLLHPGLVLFALADSAAVVLSLWLLSSEHPSTSSVRVCFNLAAAALILLIPLIVGITEQLSPESVVRRLEESARRELSEQRTRGQQVTLEERSLVALDNVVMSAEAQHDHKTFEAGLMALGRAVAQPGASTSDGSAGASLILERFEEIGYSFVADPAAIRVLARVMRDLFQEDLSSESGGIFADRLIRSVRQLGVTASRHGHEASVRPIVATLGDLGRRCVDESATQPEDSEASARLRGLMSLLIGALTELGEQLVEGGQTDTALRLTGELAAFGLTGAGAPESERSAIFRAAAAAEASGRLAATAAEHGLPDVAAKAIRGLSSIAKASFEVGSEFSAGSEARGWLETLARTSAEEGHLEVAAAAIEALGEVGESAVRARRHALSESFLQALSSLWDAIRADKLGDRDRPLVFQAATAAGKIGEAAAQGPASAEPVVDAALALLVTLGDDEVRLRREGQPKAGAYLNAIATHLVERGDEALLRLTLYRLGHLAATAVRTPPGRNLELDYLLHYPIDWIGKIGAAAAGLALDDAAEVAVEALRIVGITMQEQHELEGIVPVVRALEAIAEADVSARALAVRRPAGSEGESAHERAAAVARAFATLR